MPYELSGAAFIRSYIVMCDKNGIMQDLVHPLHQVVNRYSVSLGGWVRKNPLITLIEKIFLRLKKPIKWAFVVFLLQKKQKLNLTN